LCDTREVKTSLLLRPLHNSQLQSYGTTYVFNQFWNQILISSQIFSSIFSINQWCSTALSDATFCSLSVWYSDRWTIFLSSGLNRGFYIPVLLPVHRGVLSVVTLNGRALVPIGEYNIIPPFHVGSTPRTVGRTHRSSCICHD
jgi:hypothetical protein